MNTGGGAPPIDTPVAWLEEGGSVGYYHGGGGGVV